MLFPPTRWSHTDCLDSKPTGVVIWAEHNRRPDGSKRLWAGIFWTTWRRPGDKLFGLCTFFVIEERERESYNDVI